ncbi:MAG TPA: hypothetical protein VNX68_13145, partial [Nitrosopumilaceae archaeon]|nr:hypothetical protein [Nitrosopumilaceae archaeon]
MSKSAHIKEADNGYICHTSEEGENGEYDPGEEHIANDMDEVHEHLDKHFGKGEKKKEEKKKESRKTSE